MPTGWEQELLNAGHAGDAGKFRFLIFKNFRPHGSDWVSLDPVLERWFKRSVHSSNPLEPQHVSSHDCQEMLQLLATRGLCRENLKDIRAVLRRRPEPGGERLLEKQVEAAKGILISGLEFAVKQDIPVAWERYKAHVLRAGEVGQRLETALAEGTAAMPPEVVEYLNLLQCAEELEFAVKYGEREKRQESAAKLRETRRKASELLRRAEEQHGRDLVQRFVKQETE